MKIIKYTSQKANIILSVKELSILKESIIEVKKNISIHEFKLRLEVSFTIIDEFLKLINKLIEQEKDNKIIKQQFSFQEIIIINIINSSTLSLFCYFPRFTNIKNKSFRSLTEERYYQMNKSIHILRKYNKEYELSIYEIDGEFLLRIGLHDKYDKITDAYYPYSELGLIRIIYKSYSYIVSGILSDELLENSDVDGFIYEVIEKYLDIDEQVYYCVRVCKVKGFGIGSGEETKFFNSMSENEIRWFSISESDTRGNL